MKLEGKGKLLRVFIGESDRSLHQPLFEAIIHLAKERGLAGCTIVRGTAGYGPNSRVIHTAKILRLSEDLPIVVEIVDADATIKAFLPEVERLIQDSHSGALITLEDVEVIRYAPTSKR
ncbi:MAG: DUF190 domain-containing protein [Ignavibacteriales bacterium]|nr:DUF190 domain-containing protein [Ignavibacteriales bacterium]